MIEAWLLGAVVVVLAMGVGVGLGWFLRGQEVVALREVWERGRRDFVERLEDSRQAVVDLHAHYRADQARMLREIVTMRKLGFVPVDDDGDEDGGTWVLNDAHEAEVSEQRRRAGSRSESEIRTDHAEVVQELGAALHQRP